MAHPVKGRQDILKNATYDCMVCDYLILSSRNFLTKDVTQNL